MFSKLESKRKDGHLMSEGILPNSTDVKSCKGSRRLVFYKKDVLRNVWRQVLM